MIFKKILIIIILIFISCKAPTEQISYERKPVVFGYIDAGFNKINPIYLYWSNNFSTSHNDSPDYIILDNNDTFTLSDGTSSINMVWEPEVNGYIPDSDVPDLAGGSTWNLNIAFDNYELNASTEIPESITLESISSQIPWNCDGYPVNVDEDFEINLANETEIKSLVYDFLNSRSPEPSDISANASQILEEIGLVDFITYDTRECYTSSFASVPYFTIDLGSEDENIVARYISVALEKNKDMNNDGLSIPYEAAIFDTTLSANAFKGPMKYFNIKDYYIGNELDNIDIPYEWGWHREPIDTINLTGNIIDIMWLFFDYYGINMMIVQPMGQEYEKYYESDPDEFSFPYILRESNIESNQGSAYGLFYSTNSEIFFFDVRKEQSN